MNQDRLTVTQRIVAGILIALLVALLVALCGVLGHLSQRYQARIYAEEVVRQLQKEKP